MSNDQPEPNFIKVTRIPNEHLLISGIDTFGRRATFEFSDAEVRELVDGLTNMLEDEDDG